MAVVNFNGRLKSNEVFSAIYNMIISQEVLSDNFTGGYSALISRFKTDGTLYGDTKLYYSTDVLTSKVWNGTETNVLELHRDDIKVSCDSVVLDQFRQIRLTLDNYLSKRAWSTEGAFSSFTSVLLGMIRNTRKLFDDTTINTFIGTATKADQTITSVTVDKSDIPGASNATGLDAARIEAMAIGEALADLLANMKDYTRDYNSYGYMRSYSPDDLVVVWNTEWLNRLRKVDLPTIFHKEGIVDKFEEESIPGRYFGAVNAASGTVGDTAIRSLIEKDYGTTHCYPGDLIPKGQAYGANETYTPDSNIIAKIVHKNGVKYMSAFEVATSFFNPRSLTENHYLTFGYSKPKALDGYPVITLKM